LHRREGQRTHGSAAPQAAFRRHRRSDHPARTQAEPRLVGVVKSSRARNKIKHWLNVHQRERAIEIGKKLLEKEARKYRISLKEIKEADLQRAASEYGLGVPTI